ncbi:polysaccharide deacetylase family protein [Dactylosporangium sp. NPDC051485]|uniref:polysaccharide deacetylase family protein n=1 Tax=Dactylosporangium sp. NPDC051485 TaxID=3154846 RepID=UPI003444D4EB
MEHSAEDPGPAREPLMVVSVHDVAPATADETARWCADADALGIPVSLLVIPGPWRGMDLAGHEGYAEVLRERAAGGDELVLHGWCHAAGPEGTAVRRAVGRAVARGAAEFAALDEQQAAGRLDQAKAVLDRLGLRTTGFTPPGWLASPAAVRALADAGFRYTTDHFGVKDLRSGRARRGFALSHRPGGTGERLGSRILQAGAAWAARRRGLVRVALHPDDLHRPGLRDDTLRAIEGALKAGARATTYGALVDAAAS